MNASDALVYFILGLILGACVGSVIGMINTIENPVLYYTTVNKCIHLLENYTVFCPKEVIQ